MHSKHYLNPQFCEPQKKNTKVHFFEKLEEYIFLYLIIQVPNLSLIRFFLLFSISKLVSVMFCNFSENQFVLLFLKRVYSWKQSLSLSVPFNGSSLAEAEKPPPLWLDQTLRYGWGGRSSQEVAIFFPNPTNGHSLLITRWISAVNLYISLSIYINVYRGCFLKKHSSDELKKSWSVT